MTCAHRLGEGSAYAVATSHPTPPQTSRETTFGMHDPMTSFQEPGDGSPPRSSHLPGEGSLGSCEAPAIWELPKIGDP